MSPGQLQTWVLKTTAFFFPLHSPPPPPKLPDPGCDSRQVWPQWSGLKQPFPRNWRDSRFSPVDVWAPIQVCLLQG